jgi:hypothetical protein
MKTGRVSRLSIVLASCGAFLSTYAISVSIRRGDGHGSSQVGLSIPRAVVAQPRQGACVTIFDVPFVRYCSCLPAESHDECAMMQRQSPAVGFLYRPDKTCAQIRAINPATCRGHWR